LQIKFKPFKKIVESLFQSNPINFQSINLKKFNLLISHFSLERSLNKEKNSGWGSGEWQDCLSVCPKTFFFFLSIKGEDSILFYLRKKFPGWGSGEWLLPCLFNKEKISGARVSLFIKEEEEEDSILCPCLIFRRTRSGATGAAQSPPPFLLSLFNLKKSQPGLAQTQPGLACRLQHAVSTWPGLARRCCTGDLPHAANWAAWDSICQTSSSST